MQRRSRATVIALAVAVSLGLAACSDGSGATSSAVTDVTVAESADVLAEPGVTVIDVRTPQEYAEGHLEGAINLDVQSATFDDDVAALTKDGSYLVYCRTGNRSGVATDRMAELGFTTVYDLQGGVTAWQADGGALVTD